MLLIFIFAMFWQSREAFIVIPLASSDVMDQRSFGNWFRYFFGEGWIYINRDPDVAPLEDHFFHTFMDESLKNMGAVRYRWFIENKLYALSCTLFAE